MPATTVPTTFLASWSEDATNITLPIASVTGLTAAEADGASGDIREILRTLLETVYAVYAAQDAADRWTKCTMQKAVAIDPITNLISTQFTLNFTTSLVSQNMVAEA